MRFAKEVADQLSASMELIYGDANKKKKLQ